MYVCMYVCMYVRMYVCIFTAGPRGLRYGSVDVRLLGLRARIPPGAWMSVSCYCCVFSGRGLSVGLITRPEESYEVWCVSTMRRPWPTRGGCAKRGGGVEIYYCAPGLPLQLISDSEDCATLK